MCGFIITYGDLSFDMNAALATISHRGPDSQKIIEFNGWKIGFNRLSIVGRSPDFDQPYSKDFKTDVLVFNGEIYNYKELAKKHNIAEEICSDTQVLYYLIKYYGATFIENLDGIFSFAYIDYKKNTVLVGRDHFGVKPLYYNSKPGTLYLASELSPIRKHLNNTYDYKGLVQYLSYGSTLDNKTIYNGIKKIDKSSIYFFSPYMSGLNITKYTPELINTNLSSVEDVVTESVLSQIPDINYGLLFSGGVDSSIILSICRGHKGLKSIYSVSVNDNEMDESIWQNTGIRKMNATSLHKTIQTKKTDFSVETLKKTSVNLDLPITHPNFIGALSISKQANSDGIKVLLSGEGADELYHGYRWHLDDKIPYKDILGYVPLELISLCLDIDIEEYNSFDNISMDRFFLDHYLERWLVRSDLTGMANSIEVRVPFLSNLSYSVSRRLSTTHKTNYGKTGKYPLKQITAKKFGKNYAYRNKRGFDYPLNHWIGDDYFNLLRQGGLVSEKSINYLQSRKKDHYIYSRAIFVLAMFQLWSG